VDPKTVLLIDDEPLTIEPLEIALIAEGFKVLKATTGEEALKILQSTHIDLATVDIMMPPGSSMKHMVDSHNTGLFLCKSIRTKYPRIDLFCLSVVNDEATIGQIKRMGIRFIRKGETPLRTVVAIIRTRLTGIAWTDKYYQG
jgi:DNA-binding NarL/FixJ family response regulator